MVATRTKTLSIRLAATGGKKLKREFDQLGKGGKQAFDKVAHSTKPASAGLKTIDAGARAVNNVLRQTAKQATVFLGAFAGFHGIKNSLGFIVSTNRDFERMHASLKTVTGSVQNADQAFKMIENFASSTPFNVGEITEAFIKLQALGLEPSAEALRSYGNTASAMGKSIMQFTEAVADAITGEFERLKEFGIKAQTHGKQVSFTFQGITKTVGKNAQEIEAYLRQIGSSGPFANAMKDQMTTLGGIFSNIQDNFSKLAREVGAGGLNDAIREFAANLKEATDNGKEAARSLGAALAFLARNAVPAVEALTALLIARTLSRVMTAMNLAVARAATGFRSMATISAVAATRMAVAGGAAKLLTLTLAGLRKVISLLGGPTGIVVLAGFALYKLAKGHDAAEKAAKDHHASLLAIQDELKNTTEDIEALNKVSRDEALVRWTKKLHLAQENIRQVARQLKEDNPGSFWDKFTGKFGPDLRGEIFKTQWAFRLGKLSIEEYEAALWKLARKYPEFSDAAEEVKKRILILRAAMMDETEIQKQIDNILSGNEKKTEKKRTPASSSKRVQEIAKRHEEAVEKITRAFHALKPAAEQARIEAAKWRDETLDALDRTKAGYDTFRAQIASVYQDKLRGARDLDLENSKHWEDGLKRGAQSVLTETQNMAAQMESLVKDAFQGMEDSLVDFVMTGKLDFKSLVDSILADIVRLQIKQAIIQPLSSTLGALNIGSLFGVAPIGLAHTGGVIGEDNLPSRTVQSSVFVNAPKYHRGGIVGDEIPIIAKRGETVFTPGQMRLLSSSLQQKEPVKVEVNVKNSAPGVQAHVEPAHLPGGGVQLDIIVEQIEGSLARNVSRGKGLAPTLERRYGLNPAVGSYR